ncbi:MAG: hypothetical protein FWE04_03590 [Oscillospiraceae bacterium]|nr:hypothetical protein [Oscillospiraceae bacterium]
MNFFKKGLAAVIILSMVLALFSFTAVATPDDVETRFGGGATTLSFTGAGIVNNVLTVLVPEGGHADIALTISTTGAYEAAGARLRFGWDPTRISAVSIVNPPFPNLQSMGANRFTDDPTTGIASVRSAVPRVATRGVDLQLLNINGNSPIDNLGTVTLRVADPGANPISTTINWYHYDFGCEFGDFLTVAAQNLTLNIERTTSVIGGGATTLSFTGAGIANNVLTVLVPEGGHTDIELTISTTGEFESFSGRLRFGWDPTRISADSIVDPPPANLQFVTLNRFTDDPTTGSAFVRSQTPREATRGVDVNLLYVAGVRPIDNLGTVTLRVSDPGATPISTNVNWYHYIFGDLTITAQNLTINIERSNSVRGADLVVATNMLNAATTVVGGTAPTLPTSFPSGEGNVNIAWTGFNVNQRTQTLTGTVTLPNGSPFAGIDLVPSAFTGLGTAPNNWTLAVVNATAGTFTLTGNIGLGTITTAPGPFQRELPPADGVTVNTIADALANGMTDLPTTAMVNVGSLTNQIATITWNHILSGTLYLGDEGDMVQATGQAVVPGLSHPINVHAVLTVSPAGQRAVQSIVAPDSFELTSLVGSPIINWGTQIAGNVVEIAYRLRIPDMGIYLSGERWTDLDVEWVTWPTFSNWSTIGRTRVGFVRPVNPGGTIGTTDIPTWVIPANLTIPVYLTIVPAEANQFVITTPNVARDRDVNIVFGGPLHGVMLSDITVTNATGTDVTADATITVLGNNITIGLPRAFFPVGIYTVNIAGFEPITAGANTFTITAGGSSSILSIIMSGNLNFGTVEEGYAQRAERIVTVTNHGTMRVTDLEITAVPDGWEVVRGLNNTTLLPLESATFTIRPELGLPAGNHSGNIIVTALDYYEGTAVSHTMLAGFTVSAPPPSPIALTVSSLRADSGDNITVDISISGNPGFASMPLRVQFPDELTLIRYDILDDELFSGFTGPEDTQPGETTSISGQFFANWVRVYNFYESDAVLLRLTFATDSEAVFNVYPVEASFAIRDYNSIPRNADGEELNIPITNGRILLRDFIPGDIDGDGTIDLLDVSWLAKYLADHDVEINHNAAMVTEASILRGRPDLDDAVRLKRYLVGHDITKAEMNYSDFPDTIIIPDNAIRLSGRVVANRYTNLFGPEIINNQSTAPETVRLNIYNNFGTDNPRYAMPTIYPFTLNNVAFRVGNTNAANFIGQRVVFYIVEEYGQIDDVIVSIVPETNRNVSTRFNIADFDRFEFDWSGNDRIRYFRNAGSRVSTTLSLADNYTVIYNGRTVWDDEIFTHGQSTILGNSLSNGTITVIDTNGTGWNDLIIVNSPQIFVVDEVDTNARVLIARNPVNSRLLPSVIELDTSRLDVSYRITRNGRRIGLGDINEGDVLAVEVNMVNIVDDFLYNIRVLTNTIEGRVAITSASPRSWEPSEWVDSQGNLLPGPTFWIDGTEYYVAVGAYDTSRVRVGSEGTFVLDEFGNIAAFKAPAELINYGFVMMADTGDDGFSRRGLLQILHRDGSVSTRRFAPVVNIENSPFGVDSFRGDGGAAGNFAPLPGGLSFFENKLIRYSVNVSGQITSVEFARSNGWTGREFSSVGPAYVSRTFAFDVRNDRVTTVDYLTPRLSANVNNDTLIFDIQTNEFGEIDSARSGVRTVDDFLFHARILEQVQLFDLNERTGVVQVIVAFDHDPVNADIFPGFGSAEPPDPAYHLAVFNSVAQTINDSDERVRSVEFFQNGERRNLLSTVNTAHHFDNMLRGTAFRYSVNERDEIYEVSALFELDNISVDNTSTSHFTHRLPTLVNLATSFELELGALPNEVSVWTDFDEGQSIIMGPVVQTGAGFITVGPRFTDGMGHNWHNTEAQRWNFASMRYNIRSGANVYVLDMSQGVASMQLIVGDLGNINRPHQQWLTAGARLRTTSLDSWPDFPAPAIAVRDWVVMQMIDGIVTDVIILKAFPYELRL